MSKEDLNLGWLASRQSGIPQKVKTIGGVSTASCLDLKAQKERVKGIAQGVKEGTIEPGERRKRGIDLSSLGPSNSGVRDRDERDKQLQLKEVRSTENRSCCWPCVHGLREEVEDPSFSPSVYQSKTEWNPAMAEALEKKAQIYEKLREWPALEQPVV